MANTFTGTSFPLGGARNPTSTNPSLGTSGGLLTQPIRWGKGNNATTQFDDRTAAGASASRELFLKVFSGQVLTAYNQRQELEGKCPTYSATAKSVQFPRTGISSAKYHQAGEEMVGDDFATGELTITADAILVSKHEFYDLDSNFAHFDIHANSADQMGQALANVADQSKFKQIIRAARSSGNQASDSRFPTGSVFAHKELERLYTSTTDALRSGDDAAERSRQVKLYETTGACYDGWAFMKHIRRAQARFFQLKVPHGTQFWCYVPYDVYDAIKYAYTDKNGNTGGEFINQNRDFTGDAVGGFMVNDLMGIKVDNIMILPSFNMPTGVNEIGDTLAIADADAQSGYSAELSNGDKNETYFKYRNNFAKTKGVLFASGCIGSLNYGGVQFEHTRDTRRLADFYVARSLMGHGTLRRELAIELSSSKNDAAAKTAKELENVALGDNTIFANG